MLVMVTVHSGVGRKCSMVGHVIANIVQHACKVCLKGVGSGGTCHPRKLLNCRPSEIIFGAF